MAIYIRYPLVLQYNYDYYSKKENIRRKEHDTATVGSTLLQKLDRVAKSNRTSGERICIAEIQWLRVGR